METNHKSKHEKCLLLWFVQSVGKFDEGVNRAFGLTTYLKINRVPNPLSTLSANHLQTSCPKPCPKCNTNQHGTQIKRLSPLRKVTDSSSHAPSYISVSIVSVYQQGFKGVGGGTKPWQSLPRHPPQTWVPTSSGQGGIIFFMVTLLYVQSTQNKNNRRGC